MLPVFLILPEEENTPLLVWRTVPRNQGIVSKMLLLFLGNQRGLDIQNLVQSQDLEASELFHPLNLTDADNSYQRHLTEDTYCMCLTQKGFSQFVVKDAHLDLVLFI